MKKRVLVVLFVLFTASSAFAACKVEGAAALKVNGAQAMAAPTLSAGLDKVARKYQEMWIPDSTGKKVRRACDFQCTQACSEYRTECYFGGGGSWYCEGQWTLCMCENNCCWGPGGNPYC